MELIYQSSDAQKIHSEEVHYPRLTHAGRWESAGYGVLGAAYSRLSPMSQTLKTPSSGMPFCASAFFNNLGGSKTSSVVRIHVPQ